MGKLWVVWMMWSAGLGAVPLFNTISLEEYGERNNFNLTLQPIALQTLQENPNNPLDKQLVRTNDFQVLQQVAASDRQAIRINQFYVSQGPEGVGLTAARTQSETTIEITTPIDDFQILFGAIESQDLVRSTNLSSSQMMTVTYELPPTGAEVLSVPPDDEEITVPQISVLYACVAPVIRTGGPQIARLFVDGEEVSVIDPIPAGRQFVVELETGQVFYLDILKSALPALFTVSGDLTELASTIPFTGFFRFGCQAGELPVSTFNEFQRNQISPQFDAGIATIDQIAVDGVLVDDLDAPLPAGRRFDFVLSTLEQWRIETDLAFPEVEVVLNEDHTTLRATAFYTGPVQFGCVPPDVLLTPNEELTLEGLPILFTPQAEISNARTPQMTIRDYNVIGNAYHDIEYNQLTPQITLGDTATLTQLFIDDVPISLTTPDPFPAGRKFTFVFTFQRPDGTTAEQTWLVYIEQSFTPPFPGNALGSLGADLDPIGLALNFTQDALTLAASEPFTGILRVAVLQTNPVPNNAAPDTNPIVTDVWSTTAVTQTRPATPIAQYLLWPMEWTPKIGEQITSFLPRSFEVPACSQIADLLPVLALTDFRRALAYFDQIIATDYSSTSNPFNTYFLMALARELSTDITLYQSLLRPMPAYGITPSAALTEAAYDAARSRIPIAADITFDDNAYHWTYTCIDGAQNPLILFPGYKTIDPLIHGSPILGFAYLDAIKGDLLGIEAVDCAVHFVEGPVPAWYDTAFIPPFTLSGRDLSRLQLLFAGLAPPAITGTSIGEIGPELLELALTTTFAVYTYDQIPALRAFIRSFTEPTIDVIKNTLTQYVITRVDDDGFELADFFIGDERTPGVCASAGLFARNQEVVEEFDDGNAIYNQHHRQYGYWLSTIAQVMAWDDRFMPESPWIAQTVTLADGSTALYKDYVDMLWRDARNVDKDDPDLLPYNRHGNSWEGHSTDNGFLYNPLPQGRSQANLAEDFNSWVGVNQYARAVLATPALTSQQQAGFDLLSTFSQTNMQLAATSGKLIYQDDTWLYGFPYDVNVTVGEIFDTQTTVDTRLDAGTPPCELFTPR